MSQSPDGRESVQAQEKDGPPVPFTYYCNTHGKWDPLQASGCPECVVELRRELRAQVERYEKERAEIVGILRRRIPEKQRGAWDHGYGCPAEDCITSNTPCTCGEWAQIDADNEVLRALTERGKP